MTSAKLLMAVQEERGRCVRAGGPDPTHLYVGDAETLKLREMTYHSAGESNASGLGKEFFMGMEVHRVLEASHLRSC